MERKVLETIAAASLVYKLVKKLNSTERGAFFDIFASPVITTAHAHKSGVIFHICPRAFKQKKLRRYDQR